MYCDRVCQETRLLAAILKKLKFSHPPPPHPPLPLLLSTIHITVTPQGILITGRYNHYKIQETIEITNTTVWYSIMWYLLQNTLSPKAMYILLWLVSVTSSFHQDIFLSSVYIENFFVLLQRSISSHYDSYDTPFGYPCGKEKAAHSQSSYFRNFTGMKTRRRFHWFFTVDSSCYNHVMF